MGQAKLKELDEIVDTAVSYELGDADASALERVGISPRRTRTVAGLTIVARSVRDASADPVYAAQLDGLRLYRLQRQYLLEKCKRIGIEPLAVLPAKTWDAVAKRYELYRFTPTGNQVLASFNVLHHMIDEEVRRLASEEVPRMRKRSWLHAGAAAALTASGAALGNYLGYLTPLAYAWLILPIVMKGIGACYISEYRNSRDAKNKHGAAAAKNVVASVLADGGMHKLLWPHGTEEEKGELVEIQLPNPPAEVQEQVARLEQAHMKIGVAADKAAIGISGDALSKALYGSWVAQLPQLKDPIVFVQEGNAVAIIAQYGDFEVERAAIQEIVSVEHLA